MRISIEQEQFAQIVQMGLAGLRAAAEQYGDSHRYLIVQQDREKPEQPVYNGLMLVRDHKGILTVGHPFNDLGNVVLCNRLQAEDRVQQLNNVGAETFIAVPVNRYIQGAISFHEDVLHDV